MSQQLGWLDTNIFVHNLFENDREYPRCRKIFADLKSGEAEAWIDPIVVFELTYALRRHPAFRTRGDIYTYLHFALQPASIHALNKPALLDALAHWNETGVGFVDAWLRGVVQRSGLPLCSANRRDFPDIENTF